MPDAPTSLRDFAALFPDEQACAEYLEGVRWPEGFTCPRCGVKDEPYRFTATVRRVRCRACGATVHLTAGTVMHRSHSPLDLWFWGAYLMTSLTPGISAVQFRRQLGLSRYETAWNMLHKLRAGMVRPDRDRIGEEWPVEVDEAYVGGKTRGEGRGVTHKTIVIGAVEVRERVREHAKSRKARYAGRLRLRVLKTGRDTTRILKFVEDAVEPGATVRTDGWRAYQHLPGMGYRHEAVTMEHDPEKAEKHLPMVHLVFSNLKTWLQGTHHGVSRQHLQAYLNEFVFRFNRRFYPFEAFHSALGIAVGVPGPTYDGLYDGTWRHPNPRFAGLVWEQMDLADLGPDEDWVEAAG